ncbi:cell growth regulator with RING finger domain protein 1 [Triplophysa rosa]|uniref:RING-type domain-containing protein n=1 Tax=Triplophysa rosa TaxID=992332 RepID=A0A9W7T3K9_TRIRA|nr:cell growth regulator with RING finger domain protein 1 [Triplophysa rosa]KAI7790010.1 putative protein similar to vertebrate cell growth regulator with ring finger domain 1 CGRRF1 [Triplophysa rosa]
MAAGFLVMLYEYSPLFYITIISVCFIITVAVVLGWFGFDVPVILRSSDDTESLTPVPERKMVLVTNPFALEMSSTAGTVTEGLSLQAYCLEDCVLCCFWGCEVRALQSALQSHQHGPRLCTPELFQDALEFSYHLCQNFNLQREKKEECFTQMQPELGVNDFGFLPRDRYPLVAVLMLTNTETRDNYNIVASVTVLHVPDDKYRISARILFQYLLTTNGSLYDLKPLFMSADNSNLSGTNEPSTTREGSGLQNKDLDENGEESEKEWTDYLGRDCVVCQNAPINRVLLPCRHACVCDGCVYHFLHCPICRAFVLESFALSNNPTHDEDKEEDLMED